MILQLVEGATNPTGPIATVTTSQLILAILGTAGVASVLGAIITGFFNRKKLGADATEIITKAASGVVENIKADNVDLRQRNEKLERALEEERRKGVRRDQEMEHFRRLAIQHTHVLQMHAAWDALAVTALEKAGVEGLPTPPPPLYGPDLTPSDLRGTLDIDTLDLD